MHAVDGADRRIVGAQPDEAAGDLLGVEGEVLAAHDRRRLQHLRRPTQEIRADLPRQGPTGGIVDRWGIVLTYEAQLGLAAVGPGHQVGHLPQALLQPLQVVHGQCTERTGQANGLGGHVEGLAAMNRGDADDARLERVHLPGDQGLEFDHQLGGGQHRIAVELRHGGVAALSANDDLDRGGGGQEDSGAAGDAAAGRHRPHVQAEDARYRRVLQGAFVAHAPATGAALLGRLEEQLDRTPQLRFPRLEQSGGAQQHGGMAVVAAGMHDPVDLAGEVQAATLLDGQGVHVGAQSDAGPVPLPQHRQDAGLGDGRPVTDAQLVERLADQAAGLVFLVHQLRAAVDAAPKVHDPGGNGLSLFDKVGGGHGLLSFDSAHHEC